MANDLKSRIKQRLDELGLSAEGASKKAGLSRSFLRLLMMHETGNPRTDSLIKLAEALETTPNWLMTGSEGDAPVREVRPADVERPLRQEMPADVPVMGTAAGSHAGSFQFEDDVIDYVRRPPALMGAKDIYAIYVEGSSMEPEHRPGDLRFVHPHRPPRVGDSVVVQIRSAQDAPVEAMIGHLIRRNGETIVIGKLNPQTELSLQRITVVSIHKVLDMNELFGV